MIKKLLLIIILITGFLLRVNHYAEVPFPGESRDEYSFTWLGLSLLTTGVPVATSGLPSYSHQWHYLNVDDIYHKFSNSNPFPVDSPWFDHPPLFSLLPGLFNLWRGITNFTDASLAVSRQPLIFIGVLNIFLVYWLASLISNSKVGLLSAAIFAVSPVIVISSRTVQAENLLITLFLLSLVSFYNYQKSGRGWLLWLTISLSGLSTLVKVSGWSICLSLLILTLIFQKAQTLVHSLLIFLGTLLIFLAFPIYGFIYDWKLFQSVWLTNTARDFREGLESAFFLFVRPNISRNILDGWLTLGWIAAALLSQGLHRVAKAWWIIVPLICCLTVYLFLGGDNFGWYKYPFFPFLVISLGWVIYQNLKTPNPVFSLFLVFLPLSIMLNRLVPPEILRGYMLYYRLSLLMVFSLLLFPRTAKFTLFLMLTSLFGLSIYTGILITPQSWYNVNWLSFF